MDGQQWPEGHDSSIVGCPKTLLLWIDCNDQESRMNMECLSAVVSYQIAKNGYVDKSKRFFETIYSIERDALAPLEKIEYCIKLWR